MTLFSSLSDKSVTQKMVFTAILAVIAYLLNMIEIPYIVPFLRLDISEAVVIFAVIILGLRYALTISFIKAFLFFLSGANGSEIVGLTILFLSSCFLATMFYLCYRKGKLNIYLSLIITGILFATLLTTVNYFFTVPFYNKMSFDEMNSPGYLWATVSLYFPFNILKMILVSIIVVFLDRTLLPKKRKKLNDVK